MKHKRKCKKLWVAVKVERGLISKAKVCESFFAAQRTVHRWRSCLNPDYDEAEVLEAC
jgi:hypothetical protein